MNSELLEPHQTNGLSPYRFMLRPRWIIGFLIVISAVIAFINFGFWQLRRLDEKRTHNALVEDRMQKEPASLEALIKPSMKVDDARVEAIIYRQVTVRGRFDPSGEVLVRSRSLHGQAGFHVLSPLVLSEAEAVLINRGWVPNPEAKRQSPSGQVEITGLVLGTQRRPSIGPTDPPSGVLEQISRSDIERVQNQYRLDLYPVIVQASASEPNSGLDLPIILPAPSIGEGNHLSYAAQWFSFTVIVAIGWIVLIRRTAAAEAPKQKE